MLSNIRKIMVAGALMLAAALTVPASAAAQTATFTVFNQSHYQINHLYVSPTNYNSWGSDTLGYRVFPPNYRYDLAVTPGYYDVRLVDQDGDSCVVPSVDFRNGDSWTITDGTLLTCELISGL
jgi:hypothetical protein